MGGIVTRLGEFRPVQQSVGTQYSKPPFESVTQPFGSGCAQKSTSVCVPEKDGRIGGCGNSSHTWIVVSQDPDTMCCPSGEQAMDFTPSACPVIGLPISTPVVASHIRMVLSRDEEIMWYPLGE